MNALEFDDTGLCITYKPYCSLCLIRQLLRGVEYVITTTRVDVSHQKTKTAEKGFSRLYRSVCRTVPTNTGGASIRVELRSGVTAES